MRTMLLGQGQRGGKGATLSWGKPQEDFFPKTRLSSATFDRSSGAGINGRSEDAVVPDLPATDMRHLSDDYFRRVSFFPLLGSQGHSGNRPLTAVDHASIPILGAGEEFVDQPVADTAAPVPGGSGSEGKSAGAGASPSVAGAGPGSPTPTGMACDVPLNMVAVTSGAFQGGVDMGTYYPDLVGGGHWQHGGTAGPFDTGTRVGSNAQLVGTIQIPCRPDLFSLAQTVKYDKTVKDGVHHPNEGKTMDDIAKSGRDASRAPFRQEFMGTSGWAISMADPPNVSYGPSSDIEWDRSFVTSLVGRGGRKDVSWSTSIRVVSGTVTRNTIT